MEVSGALKRSKPGQQGKKLLRSQGKEKKARGKKRWGFEELTKKVWPGRAEG